MPWLGKGAGRDRFVTAFEGLRRRHDRMVVKHPEW
jgi:hypothetical protein